MNRNERLIRLVRGINADLADCNELKNLLGTQFAAALEHHAGKLGQATEAISSLLETIEARRRERVELATALLDGDPEASMPKVFALFSAASRQVFEGWWSELESLVRECKADNARVGQLLMGQHEIMQRVLDCEADIYVPA